MAKDGRQTSTAAAEALEWFVTLRGQPSAADQESFADWLRRSPVHVEEFLQLTALQGDLARLPDLKDADVDSLLAQKSAAFDLNENVVALNESRVATLAEAPRSSNRRRIFAVAAASALIALIFGFYSPIRNNFFTEHYATKTGEQRSLMLTDGSQVELNVRSSLSANLSKAVREIRLDDGEALFRVAKDPTRPFRVRTPQATIEATGTQFNVHVKKDSTVVSLLEGHVEVTSPEGGAPILLEPGQEVAIAAHVERPAAPHAMDPKTVTAWTEHRLVFEDATLAEVVNEFNRYSRQPLAIEDPSLRDMRITASFESGNAQTFAESLAAAGRLRATRQADGSWLIERRAP